jgi:hypothetical protein
MIHSFLKFRYKIFDIFGIKNFLRVRELTGLTPIYSKESKQKKVIFIHIPKAAGSSVGMALFDTDIIGHYPYYLYEKYDIKRFNSFFKFCVVREPFERLISAYFYLLNGGKGKADNKTGCYIRNNSSDLDDFILNVLNDEFCQKHVHFVPQYQFVFDHNDTLKVDQVIKLSDLESDFNQILSNLNISKKLLTNNSNNSNNSNILSPNDISDAAKQKVQLIYKKDFELFGFEFI